MGLLRDVQLWAMGCVSLPEEQQSKLDPEYGLRRVFRWYSREFHTPLHLVSQLPLLDILQNYYESIYEQMEPPELEEAKGEMLETDEERALREVDDEEWIKEAEEEAAQLALRAQRRMRDSPLGLGGAEPAVPQQVLAKPRPKQDRLQNESTIPASQPGEPIVKMTFADADLFEELLEGGFGPPPTTKP